MRELYPTIYNSEEYTDQNVLYKSRLIEPVALSRELTYLWGEDSEMFPLLTLTEGQSGLKSLKTKALNDTQYHWPVMGRMKHTSKVVGLVNASNVEPGLGFTSFEVYFEDDWFKRYYGLTTPDKQHTLRMQGKATKVGVKKWKARVIIMGGDSTEYVGLNNFIPGSAWVMTAPIATASKSDGVVSNSMAPGKMTNQFGFYRFGKEIAGNVANQVIPISFSTKSGGERNLWMPEEMKQFEIDRRLMLEDKLWNGKYNRDEYGQIHNFDDDNSEPLPEGAGVKEILKSTGQHETYGVLTPDRFDNIINRLFSNRVDNTPMELVFLGGSGAKRMFNKAFKTEAVNNSYYEKLGSEEIMSGKDGWLSYGKYFDQYKTVDGHIITIKKANIFDQGLYAELDKANGNMYDGLPYESYNMVLLDMSRTKGGERNVQLVGQAGREVITGVYKGLTPLPGSWGGIDKSKILSSKVDEASYEVMVSQGITIKNYTTSYFLEFMP